MKGNRYVQSRIFLKALIINWFFLKKEAKKKRRRSQKGQKLQKQNKRS